MRFNGTARSARQIRGAGVNVQELASIGLNHIDLLTTSLNRRDPRADVRCGLIKQCSRGKASTDQMIDDNEGERNQKKQGWKEEPHTTRPWGLILMLETPIWRLFQNKHHVPLKKEQGHPEGNKDTESISPGR